MIESDESSRANKLLLSSSSSDFPYASESSPSSNQKRINGDSNLKMKRLGRISHISNGVVIAFAKCEMCTAKKKGITASFCALYK
jgi:hypothetical protein